MTHIDSKVKVNFKVTYVKVDHRMINTLKHVRSYRTSFFYSDICTLLDKYISILLLISQFMHYIFSESPRDIQAKLLFRKAGISLGFSLDCHLD